ncbi:aldehyde dehydrogenase [Mycobacterium arosiense]|uniref:aldehyde dehydrogenase (NAD(+)) n=1 Tax=Mycobacterium arosiense ATCC BAA-1401 = DSM 45069 TaxID=1265311 RepID=A0A1W9ZCC5_MYCAI|nr:aldehyde dehydrogenase [Mycobacterium arosiense]ORA11959.1 aldehyde dehydrogenase [Mycobacterium arosiense ATCC BAA-1401 = DSM 45069]
MRFDCSELLIGGDWRSQGSEWLDVVSPSTEELVTKVRHAETADIDDAVIAARTAFDRGPWPRMSPEERAEVIRSAIQLLAARRDEIATLVTREMGAPYSDTVGQQIPGALGMAKAFTRYSADMSRATSRNGRLGWALIEQEPVGVVGAIVAWNAPFYFSILKVIPALLAGCTVVLKPAEETPISAFHLGEALYAAGLPAGALSIVPGDRGVGAHLVSHPGVDKVAFTGSTAAGRVIGATCGQMLKRSSLELGGKSAAIVLEDADLADTTPWLSAGAFYNSGQVCAALTRVLAPRRRYDEVVDSLAAAATKLRIGDPFSPDTEVGPLVSARQRYRVEGYLEIAKQEGAIVAAGGGRPSGLDRGYYLEPTVFAGVDNDMRIAREEIFGPVAVVIPYEDVDQAIAIANDSPYGLHGGVYTSDPDAGVAVARRIVTGSVSVNSFTLNSDAPFGGRKSSGYGREFGPEGIAEYLEYKTINVPAVVGEAAYGAHAGV